jgi:hypothetical protein
LRQTTRMAQLEPPHRDPTCGYVPSRHMRCILFFSRRRALGLHPSRPRRKAT